MSQTVIGIFDSTNQAQDAVEKLIARGFTRERIDISQRGDSHDVDNQEDSDWASSISGFFSNLFGNDNDEARNYAEVARRGSTITVYAENRSEAERAAEILDQAGAVDVDERIAQYRSSTDYGDLNKNSMGNTSLNTGDAYTDRNLDDMTNRKIPVIEENLEVGKREVESGGTRLHSRIVEKPVEEHVRLRNERVTVERNPVNREASQADFDTFREGTVEFKEHKEIPVVNKEARVVEEVSLNKEVEERDETIRDTVKRTEVDVDKLPKNNRNTNSSFNTNRDV
ncbi:YsnF/AvaK domain-containing protein [Pedobacter sp. SYSU D00535]|uniref:YsnF/AvaK domain-containing protein n=1 Tax=Pedobacter sp. SYSU D00535 TaxID=2810308 RepID=UPI001A96BD96|nr:YsnF/AvaK domain-containing protein [Pedobacter sp. SYSU D00535]